MGGQLNIESEDAHHLASELAEFPASSGWLDVRRLPCNGAAKTEREPLLFKGDDFAQTDIEPALKV